MQINVDATAMALAGNGAVDIENIILQEQRLFLREDSGEARSACRSRRADEIQPQSSLGVVHLGDAGHQQCRHLSILLTGAALIREREHGTIEHLLVMPVTPLEIMLAKILANGAVIVGASMLSLSTGRARRARRADRRLACRCSSAARFCSCFR